MKLIISNRSMTPIYEQIKTQIIEAILSGELSENERLPSIRQLAKNLKISVITTTRAYKDLETEGYVVNVQGKGCYVLPQSENLTYEHTMIEIEKQLAQIFDLQQRIHLSNKELLDIVKLLMKEKTNEY